MRNWKSPRQGHCLQPSRTLDLELKLPNVASSLKLGLHFRIIGYQCLFMMPHALDTALHRLQNAKLPCLTCSFQADPLKKAALVQAARSLRPSATAPPSRVMHPRTSKTHSSGHDRLALHSGPHFCFFISCGTMRPRPLQAERTPRQLTGRALAV